MVAAKKITDKTIQSLKARDRHYDFFDSTEGLAVRVAPSGRKTFCVVSRFGGKNPTRVKLGRYPDLSLEKARKKVIEWRGLLAEGIDPREREKERNRERDHRRATTFGSVAEDFFKRKLPSERFGHDVERLLRSHFVKRWEKRPIASITPLDARNVIVEIVDQGHATTARHALGNLRRLYDWSIDQQVYGVEVNPCQRLKPRSLIGERKVRTRVLNDREIADIWKAAGELSFPYGAYFKFALLTGARKNQMRTLRWGDLDLPGALWHVKVESRMKAEAPGANLVPLSAMTVDLLKDLPRFNRGDYVFTVSGGERPADNFGRAKTQIDALLSLDRWTIHDCRRTLRTGLSRLGVDWDVAELSIGHTKRGLDRVYDQHAFLDERREAFEKWAEHVRKIVAQN